jgi:site-specific recombinase XerD
MSNTPAQKNVINNISSVVNDIRSPALKYWQNEIATKGEATKEIYARNFTKFLKFVNMNPDQLLAQRQDDLLSRDIKTQRRIESKFLAFLAKKKEEGYAPATLQIIFASIRSFFEIHYFPLRMRRNDYPKGDSNGVRRATKESILKVLYDRRTRNKATERAMLLFLKDSGLRVSDARRLNCGFFLEALENNPDTNLIPISIITQKTKLLAKTFIGEEAIEAIKDYIEERREGSRNIPPETITKESSLFRTWTSGEVKRIPRGSMSSFIREAFLRNNEKRLSAHSLRKKLQTDLEKAGVNPNWIDQILGHQLINSRDAYSLPTDEELREAYTQAYQLIKVYPEINAKPLQNPKPETTGDYSIRTASTPEEAMQLLKEGYERVDTYRKPTKQNQ